MQLKGLVRIFAVLLILISLYQLSFTWLVNRHESKLAKQAREYVDRNYPAADKKYPGDKVLQALYQDTLDIVLRQRTRKLMDSTKEVKVGWWKTYQQAKVEELGLGLDLQGGMNVTMEVAQDGLVKNLANNPRDPNLLAAIKSANQRKANSSADFISLFTEAYKGINPNGRLAALFVNAKRGDVKIDDTDDKVTSFLRKQSNAAIKNTFNVLSKRIDQFGVAQPNLNLDEKKGIINVELAGVQDKERVRKYLQAAAKLQFWEVHSPQQISGLLGVADKNVEDYLNGVVKTDDTIKVKDSNAQAVTKKIDSAGLTASELLKLQQQQQPANTTVKPGTTKVSKPITAILQAPTYPFAAVASIATKDTGTLSSYMEMEAFTKSFPPDVKFLYGYASSPDGEKLKDRLDIYAIRVPANGADKAPLEGEHVTDSRQDFDQSNNSVTVHMSMDKVGAKIWGDMTTANKDKPIAIALDDFIYSAPRVNDPILNGESQITGNYTAEEGQDLANILKSGKLDAPAKIVQEQIVGPTLGEDAVNGGAKAFIISFAVIFLLMVVYYNTAGWVANIALILNLLFTIGVLSALHATLTAAGIAGLVLTIGMAVDTNVIIFERIKEELTSGKAYQLAIQEGYKRSLPPVLDAHFTTFLTALILFLFGLGPVKGFATTQMLGIALSLFCGILISRLVTDFWTNKKRHFEYFTSVSRSVFKQANFKFIEYRKVAYAISVVVLIAGVGAVFNGFNSGVEFEGGRSYIIKFDQPVKEVDVKNALNKTFGKYPIIKTVDAANQLDITTDYMIKESGNNVDSIVETKLYEGLKPFLGANTTFRDFDTKNKQGSKTVLPTISDDLKSGAKWATFWSLFIIALYIFIRFRDWRYSVGTLVALLHDVLVTLAVFSFFKNIVPFPLEIDQHFIAAVLTVIGFSMNDTVIVFDRIREYSAKMVGMEKGTIINKAINDTLSRTIMTSLTVFLTILILFIFGGEVTRGFAFAMLIGVITGTYSSIFVAAPILVDFARNKPLGAADTKPTPTAGKAKVDLTKG
jgi:SecD/SecF fusion protein